MARAPEPITSPPDQPFQPYDATASGAAEDQIAATTIYDSVPGDRQGGPWRKVQEAGAASMTTGEVDGGWSGNGASSDGGWKQC